MTTPKDYVGRVALRMHERYKNASPAARDYVDSLWGGSPVFEELTLQEWLVILTHAETREASAKDPAADPYPGRRALRATDRWAKASEDARRETLAQIVFDMNASVDEWTEILDMYDVELSTNAVDERNKNEPS